MTILCMWMENRSFNGKEINKIRKSKQKQSKLAKKHQKVTCFDSKNKTEICLSCFAVSGLADSQCNLAFEVESTNDILRFLCRFIENVCQTDWII